MSHRVTATVKVYDPDVVRATLEEMGVAFEENATWCGYYRTENQSVAFLIPAHTRQNQAFGVGFTQDPINNSLVIVSESMGGAGSVELVSEFKRKYQINMAKKKLEEFGYKVVRLPDGTYRARATARTAQMLSRRNRNKKTAKTNKMVVGRY